MLTSSDNHTAELLLRELGVQVAHSGTTAAGRERRHRPARSLGVADCRRRPASTGPGCSPTTASRATPLLAVLEMARRPQFAAIFDGLPVAGGPGTLADRFVGTPLAGTLRAKTGSSTASPVSPGVRRRAPGRLRFAFVANGNFADRTRRGAAGQDRDRHRGVSGCRARRRARPPPGPRRSRSLATRCPSHHGAPAELASATEGRRDSRPDARESGRCPQQTRAELRSWSSRTSSRRPLDPLKRLGRYVAFGVVGALLLGFGVILFLGIGALRALQTETDGTFAGNWSWAPYLIVVVAVAAWRGSRLVPGRRRRERMSRSSAKPSAADERITRADIEAKLAELRGEVDAAVPTSRKVPAMASRSARSVRSSWSRVPARAAQGRKRADGRRDPADLTCTLGAAQLWLAQRACAAAGPVRLDARWLVVGVARDGPAPPGSPDVARSTEVVYRTELKPGDAFEIRTSRPRRRDQLPLRTPLASRARRYPVDDEGLSAQPAARGRRERRRRRSRAARPARDHPESVLVIRSDTLVDPRRAAPRRPTSWRSAR